MCRWLRFCFVFLIVPFCSKARDQLSYIIKEESPAGTFIGNLLIDAGLRDLISPADGSGADLGVQLYEEKSAELFRLDGKTGKLLVAERIDRESICPHRSSENNGFPVFVGDGAGLRQEFEPSAESECQVELIAHIPPDHWVNFLVTIQDVNDHAPKFNLKDGAANSSPYVLHISEGVSPGYQVPLIGATDEDYGKNAIQSYSLHGGDFDNAVFAVKFSRPYELNLVVLTKLDYENKTSYKGFLKACDGGRPTPNCATQDLTIFITDINDNRPVFKKELYQVKISESTPVTSIITTMTAHDADSGDFGRIQYRFGQTFDQIVERLFGINENTGEVWIRRALDAKMVSRLRIPIIAQDGGPLPKTGTTILQVEIDDVNNNAPWIEIKPITSIPQRAKTTHDGYVQLWIEENQPVGTQIGIIVTGDKDVGANGEVSCELRGNTSFFQTYHSNFAREQRIYSLQSRIQFDLETLAAPARFHLQIECSDAGTPRLVSRQNIRVDVVDVNEFPAHFSIAQTQYVARLPEDSPPGTFVIQVQATDRDATAQMQYEFVDDIHGLFRIDADTGRIYTRYDLDRELVSEFKFSVRVKERDFLHSVTLKLDSDITNVTLIIEDVNDNSPKLKHSRAFHIAENRPAYNELIGKLEAYDSDLGENGTVRFRLISVTPYRHNSTFSVDPYSGELHSQVPLDREVISQYLLCIELSDLGKPPRKAIENVIVEVLDENDNKPQWRTPLALSGSVHFQEVVSVIATEAGYRTREGIPSIALLNISEKVPQPNELVKLQATDLDSKPNANLSFSVHHLYYYGEEGFYFSAHRLLKLSQKPRELDHIKYFSIVPPKWTLKMVPAEERSLPGGGLYELHLRVSDNGNPPLHSDAVLYIRDGSTRGFIGGLFSLTGRGRLPILILVATLLACSLLLLLLVCLVRKRRRLRTDDKVVGGGPNDAEGVYSRGAVLLASQTSEMTATAAAADMSVPLMRGNSGSSCDEGFNYVSLIGAQHVVCPTITGLPVSLNYCMKCVHPLLDPQGCDTLP